VPEAAPSRRGWSFQEVLPVAVGALTAVFALRRLDDFDTWWHLASGRWIVENLRVPHTDTLSHTVPDHAWINTQWLYDILTYGVYRLGGADLLVIMSAAAFTASSWLVMRNARLFVGPFAAAVLGLAALLVAEERFLIRPEMFSFILVGLVLRILLTMKRDDGARLWLLPLLVLLWANMHSLFVIAFVCIGGFAAGALCARAGMLPREWRLASDPGPVATRRLLIFAGLSVAAAFVNPYFHRGALFPLELMSRISGTGVFQAIGEFRPPFSGYFPTWSIGAFQAYFFFAFALLPVAAGLGLRRPRTVAGRGAGGDGREAGFDVGTAFVFCALAYLATLARRNTGIFAIAVTPLVASWLAIVANRLALARRVRGGRNLELAAGGAFVVLCAALAVFVARNSYYRASGVTKETGLGVFEANFPIRATRFAEEMKLPGKLYNDLTAGGYLTWHAGVPGGVFIDGRLEVYDTEFFSQYSAGLNDLAAWQRQADQYGVSTVVVFHRWANRHPLISFLAREPRWALVYYDESVVMFVRRAGNTDAIVRATAAFPEWNTRTRERLLGDPGVWGEPIERATALDTYARLLLTLGFQDRALEAWQRQLEIGGLSGVQEAAIHYRVAWLLAGKSERASARRHALIAAELSPNDPNVKRLLERLGE
jgi:hypothetical protein